MSLTDSPSFPPTAWTNLRIWMIGNLYSSRLSFLIIKYLCLSYFVKPKIPVILTVVLYNLFSSKWYQNEICLHREHFNLNSTYLCWNLTCLFLIMEFILDFACILLYVIVYWAISLQQCILSITRFWYYTFHLFS